MQISNHRGSNTGKSKKHRADKPRRSCSRMVEANCCGIGEHPEHHHIKPVAHHAQERDRHKRKGVGQHRLVRAGVQDIRRESAGDGCEARANPEEGPDARQHKREKESGILTCTVAKKHRQQEQEQRTEYLRGNNFRLKLLKTLHRMAKQDGCHVKGNRRSITAERKLQKATAVEQRSDVA